MPSSDLFPGAGTGTVASAQLLYRRKLIIRDEFPQFGPQFTGAADQNAREFRGQTTLDIPNLEKICIHLFLFPTYEEGGVVYTARNNIEWRPVFQMPPDVFTDVPGVATTNFLPFSAPSILPVGLPVFFTIPAGASAIAVEIKTPPIGGVTHREQVIVSMSASQ